MSNRYNNLLLADEACEYVNTTCGIVATNQPQHIEHFKKYGYWGRSNTKHTALNSIDRSESLPVIAAKLQNKLQKLRQGYDKSSISVKTRSMSSSSLEHGIGNCVEFSALAITYLAEKGVNATIMLCECSCMHVFVLLGSKVTGDTSLMFKIPSIDTFGVDTILCDPWYNYSFSLFTDDGNVDPMFEQNITAIMKVVDAFDELEEEKVYIYPSLYVR